DNNFVEEQLGSISGVVLEDTDNDDIGDTPIEGVEITLTDDDSGETITTTTDENGEYIFEGLEPGDYTVTFQDESEIDEDFVDVFDGDESPEDGNDGVDDLDDDTIAVTLEPGEDDEDNNAVEEQLGTISGVVLEDTDNDDIGDTPIEGVEITLTDDDSGETFTTTTDANGEYLFEDLEPG
ncbi:MAG: carboxypeptidase regulatory-like domain-containing protein, partial [Bacteroidota bacterium]